MAARPSLFTSRAPRPRTLAKAVLHPQCCHDSSPHLRAAPNNSLGKFTQIRILFVWLVWECSLVQLVIVHNHFRPGGVRRVIELAVPHLVRDMRPTVHDVLLLGGEVPPVEWMRSLRAKCGSVPVACHVDSGLGYLSEARIRPGHVLRRITTHLERHLGSVVPGNCVVWAHNLGLGRNLFVPLALSRFCGTRGLPLVLHHHDWWFDNRWARWREMRASGFRSLPRVARTIFPPLRTIRHAGINSVDARVLRGHFGSRGGWLPNLVEREPSPSAARLRLAKGWLGKAIGSSGPVWLLPCRLLRRKNVGEALLLTRWLRPGASLVTTGDVSSDDEQAYAAKLAAAAREHGWPLHLSVLKGSESGKPSVPELMGVAECLVFTSLQEGFGLPYIEAAAAKRPLIARALVNIAPDLDQFGLRLPQVYGEIRVHCSLFDLAAERRRQSKLFRAWKRSLPTRCRRWTGTPTFLSEDMADAPVPFSRLTLTAQIEVLSHPPGRSWAACQPLNPFLEDWRKRALSGQLGRAWMPARAQDDLGGRAYARRLASLLAVQPRKRLTARIASSAQEEFMQWKLGSEWLYPLLMSQTS